MRKPGELMKKLGISKSTLDNRKNTAKVEIAKKMNKKSAMKSIAKRRLGY